MLISWSQDLSGSPETSSQILSQFLWFNNTLKLRVWHYIFQNSLIKILASYRSYLKMAGLYLGSVLKVVVNGQMTCFFSVGSIKTCNSCKMEKTNF